MPTGFLPVTLYFGHCTRWHFAAAPARDFYVPLILGRLLSRSRTVSHSPPLSGPHIGRPRPLAAGPYSRVCSQSHRPVSGRSPPEHLRSLNSRSPHGTRECSSTPGAVSALSAAQQGGRTNRHLRTHSALSVPARPHGTLREEKLLIPPTMAIRGIQSGLTRNENALRVPPRLRAARYFVPFFRKANDPPCVGCRGLRYLSACPLPPAARIILTMCT